MYSSTHPIKVYAFCPKCGSAKLNVTSERSFKCPDCDFVWYVNSSAAVAAIIFNQEGKMLFTRRAVDPDKGKLDLPGGFVDPMETAEDAIRREIYEELGAKIKSLKYHCSFPNEYLFSGLSVFTIDLAFFVELENYDRLNPMDDISGIEFYSPEEVDMENELPSVSMKNIVNEVIKLRKND